MDRGQLGKPAAVRLGQFPQHSLHALQLAVGCARTAGDLGAGCVQDLARQRLVIDRSRQQDGSDHHRHLRQKSVATFFRGQACDYVEFRADAGFELGLHLRALPGRVGRKRDERASFGALASAWAG